MAPRLLLRWLFPVTCCCGARRWPKPWAAGIWLKLDHLFREHVKLPTGALFYLLGTHHRVCVSSVSPMQAISGTCVGLRASCLPRRAVLAVKRARSSGVGFLCQAGNIAQVL